jgi:hypothetical protein
MLVDIWTEAHVRNTVRRLSNCSVYLSVCLPVSLSVLMKQLETLIKFSRNFKLYSADKICQHLVIFIKGRQKATDDLLVEIRVFLRVFPV